MGEYRNYETEEENWNNRMGQQNSQNQDLLFLERQRVEGYAPGNGRMDRRNQMPMTPEGWMPGYPPAMNDRCPIYPQTPVPYPAMNPGMAPIPYYRMYGYPISFMEEHENERDMERLKEMYPQVAKEILKRVEEECDKMEYEGSLMFDERPDQIMTGQIRNRIYDQVKEQYPVPEESDRDEVFAMNKETRKRYPPKKNWLSDMIEVLLYQEMYRRRCRHRNCRRWY